VMIAMMIITTTDETTDMMIDITRTTTVTTTTTERSRLHRHRPKGATPMVHFRRPTVRSLHRCRSPSDQKQPADSIKRQGDRARQH
jgi:hypothetical protein